MQPDAVTEARAIRRRSVLVVIVALIALMPFSYLTATSTRQGWIVVAAWCCLIVLLALAVTRRIGQRISERGLMVIGTLALSLILWDELLVARGLDGHLEVATDFAVKYALMLSAGAFLFFGPRIGMAYAAAVTATWMALVLADAAWGGLAGDMLREVDVLLDSLLFYVVTMAVMRALSRQNVTLSSGAVEARSEADHDSLTGLPNRRQLEKRLQAQLDRPDANVIVAMADIDHFKSVNDTHGHDVGDVTLKAVADTLRDQIRDPDVVGRWGGEEFIVIFGDSSLPEAEAAAERCRIAIGESRPRRSTDDWYPQVTASFGLAQATSGDSVTDAVQRADEQMYRAKQAGRNRVCRETAA